ncbi:MAG: hypothetical protein KA734_00120 [Fluviicola sp.]|jgi:hypothetical protein|uniref:hypothetical protein n=1 Tax=Fluviicola sp. TaxID=1917219 RepID=UPI001B5221F2|nr:hypothetical protein [Fluviicola sp.]MBP6272478.1 hypothetical protein [Fluviicola sp.]
MRTLSAIGFVISIIGLLLAFYNQFGVVPFLNDLISNADYKATELNIALRQDYENRLNLISILCVIIGVFSVLFCSFIYLKKNTRMTMIGTLVGFIVTVLGVIHLF